MSVVQPTISLPDPLAEKAAIDKFKERFSVGRAQELTDAQQKRSLAQTALVKAQEALALAEASRQKAQEKYDKDKADRERKAAGRLVGAPAKKALESAVKREATAKTDLEEAARVKGIKQTAFEQKTKDFKEASDALETLEKQANEELQKQQYSAVEDKVLDLVKRLQSAATIGDEGGKKAALEQRIKDDFNRAAPAEDTLAAFDQTLPDIETEVLETVTDVALEPAREALGTRLVALESRGASEKRTVDAVGKKLAAADLVEIEKTLVPQITAVEELAEEFEGEHAEILNRIASLRTMPTPEETCDALTELLQKAGRRAKIEITAALKLLEGLETELDKAESEAETAVEARDAYPVLKKSAEDLIDSFGALDPLAKGYLPGNRAQKLKSAAEYFKKGEYLLARIVLEELEVALKTGLKRADAKLRKLSDEAIELEAQAAAQQLVLAQQLQAQQDQLAKEQALTPASLDAIGRDKKFATWYSKVNILRTNALVTISAGSAMKLSGGDTIEVPMYVTADGGFSRQFVIHYHKGAKSADINNPYASKMHAKPHRGNKATPRVYLSSSDWVFQFAPKISQV
jgi:hypothetical protein